jgi:hypothetical protein
MGKIIYRLFILFAVLLVFGLIIWIFTPHGTAGICQVEGVFRLGITAFAAVGIVLAGMAFWQFRLERNSQSSVKRWLTIPILILTVLGIAVPISGFTYLNSAQALNGEIKHPQLLLAEGHNTSGTPNLAVVAYTDKPTINTLNWGTQNTKSSICEEKPAVQHVFMLRDIEPATKYWYQINDGAIYNFKTPDTHNTGIHFAVGGDAHFGASDNRIDLTLKMLQQVANPSNGFNYFFSLGDLVNYGFEDNQWLKALQALSPIISMVPVEFVPGNHDTLFTGLAL